MGGLNVRLLRGLFAHALTAVAAYCLLYRFRRGPRRTPMTSGSPLPALGLARLEMLVSGDTFE
jgi:hypothetical protein